MILSCVVGLVAAATLGVFVLTRPWTGGGTAHAARGRRRSPSTAVSTTTSTATTTTITTLVPTSVALQAGPVAPVISRVPTPNPVVFFTIDDGVIRDPTVIGFMRDHHIPVTLFPIPAYVHQDPAYFDAFHAMGASVQDHTTSHPDLRRLPQGAQQREICGPLDDYTAHFGARPWLFRPPYGDMTSSVPAIARGCGIRAVVLWRGTMNDGRLDLQGGGPLRPGDIILMHFRPDLRQNIEVALNAAEGAGLHPAPLEQYLTAG